MESLSRAFAVSLLLHGAVCLWWAGIGGKGKERPVVVDLSLIPALGTVQAPGTLAGNDGGGGRAVPAAAGSHRAVTPRPATQAALPQGAEASRHAEPHPPRSAPKAVSSQPSPVVEPIPNAIAVTRHPVALPAAAGPGATVSAPAVSARPAAGPHPAPGPRLAGGRILGPKAGSGAGAEPGTAGGAAREAGDAGAATSAEQQRQKYRSEQFAYILKIIQAQLIYPERARREGWTGRAQVSFVVQEDGSVREIRLLRKTGHQLLDLNLVRTIQEAAPFPRPPVKAELQMSLSYRLDQ
ncbi:energy transducer TonB [Geomesophilobacter sediminis]|uniref:Energy transducer TonB n=1 Tax=Geomesophilobacter sediminis TaxID=2798584 RepID=A0A8J7JKX0_9BACT|nr:TonB family protein [Geomesophilobacter sediminis]MBJ6725070.1 energy transducer TonB [Geomesophilobacter sediminis]